VQLVVRATEPLICTKVQSDGATRLVIEASPDIACDSSDANYPFLFVASLLAIIAYGCAVPLVFVHKLRSAAGHRIDLGGRATAAYLALVAGAGVALYFASEAFHHPLLCQAPACASQYDGSGTPEAMIRGNFVSDLINHESFPDSPDEVMDIWSGNFEDYGGPSQGTGALLEGFVVAPASGDYRFSIRQETAGEVRCAFARCRVSYEVGAPSLPSTFQVWASTVPWVAAGAASYAGLVKAVVGTTGAVGPEFAEGTTAVAWEAGMAYYVR